MPENTLNYALFASNYRQNIKYLSRLSRDLNTILIGGTIIEKNNSELHNTSYTFHHGEKIGSYRKCHPTENELRMGICPGNKNIVVQVDGIKIGILICADALYPAGFRKMKKMDVDMIFIPTVSPLLTGDTVADKTKRDQEIFVEGAKMSGAYIIKTCGIGEIFKHKLNGRSLIASPWGILWQIPEENEQLPYIHNMLLDIDELREFRRAAIIREIITKTSLQN